MGITYEEALKAQKAIEDKLLLDSNIVSIGVVEELNWQGEKSGNFIIKVGVISFETYQHALAHGESSIPNEITFKSDNGNQEIKQVQIKVVKTGQIKTLHSSNEHKPSAIDRHPSANSHIFAKDNSLKIARRHYSSLPATSYYQLRKSTPIIHKMFPNLLLRRRSIFLTFGIFSLKSIIDFTKSKTLQSDIPAINKKL
jgi:hypothetical protein